MNFGRKTSLKVDLQLAYRQLIITKGIVDTLISSLRHSNSSIFTWQFLLIRLEAVVIPDLSG